MIKIEHCCFALKIGSSKPMQDLFVLFDKPAVGDRTTVGD